MRARGWDEGKESEKPSYGGRGKHVEREVVGGKK